MFNELTGIIWVTASKRVDVVQLSPSAPDGQAVTTSAAELPILVLPASRICKDLSDLHTTYQPLGHARY